MNFQKLEMEILRGARGALSQQELSRRLGFGFNQVYRWEGGLLNIRWKDFVRFCKFAEVDLHFKLRLFYGIDVLDLKAKTVVVTLKGLRSLDALAKQLGRSPRVLQRWQNGTSEPYLKDILKLMYVTSQCLLEFSAQLAGKRGLPTFSKELNQRKMERDFHFAHPEFGAIIRCFELTEYEAAKTHSAAFIAKKINLKVKDVTQLIQLAEEKGLVRSVRGKYEVVNKSLSTLGDLEGRKRILNYWMTRQIEGISAQKSLLNDDVQSGYFVFTTNQVTFDKLCDLRRQFFRAASGLLHHDDNRAGCAPLDRVVVLQHNLMNIADI